MEASVKASMEVPMYFRESGVHGSFHESSASFQILPERRAKVVEANYNQWKFVETNGNNPVPRKLPWKLPLALPRKLPLVNFAEYSSFHGSDSFPGSGGNFHLFRRILQY